MAFKIMWSCSLFFLFSPLFSFFFYFPLFSFLSLSFFFLFSFLVFLSLFPPRTVLLSFSSQQLFTNLIFCGFNEISKADNHVLWGGRGWVNGCTTSRHYFFLEGHGKSKMKILRLKTWAKKEDVACCVKEMTSSGSTNCQELSLFSYLYVF